MSCAPNEVTATEEQLVDVLFGERPAAEVRWVKAEHEIYAAECQWVKATAIRQGFVSLKI
jgi:hypothetical protein